MTIQEWYKATQTISKLDMFLLVEHCKTFKYRPKISIITPVYNTDAKWFEQCIQSVMNQVYDNWEWCICNNGSTDKKTLETLTKLTLDPRVKITTLEVNGGISGGTNAAIDIATGDYSIFLDSDDKFLVTTLYYIVWAVNNHQNLKFLYGDQLFIEENGTPREVFFKPDFSPNFLRSRNYIDHPKIFRTDLLKELKLVDEFHGSQDYDLLLRMTEKCSREEIYHIPTIMYIWRKHNDSNSQSNVSWPIAGAIKALEQHLERVNLDGEVVWDWPWYRVKYKIAEPLPRVGILVCSLNKENMLLSFIRNILRKTSYPNYCIYLCVPEKVKIQVTQMYKYFVDNSSIKFVDRTDKEPYNFSVFQNRMVEDCTEDYICQMNDDIEPINDDWLYEMISLSVQNNNGVIGSKLVYPNMNIQHAGCVLGVFGTCEHIFKNHYFNTPGYHGRTLLITDVAMVTAACSVVRKSIYKEVGGYDENLAVAFNDVDFCIKVMKAGYYNVLNPNALLIHYESATRGLDDTPAKKALCQSEAQYVNKKWGDLLKNDPFYNPNLTLDGNNYEYTTKSRFVKPWLK